MIRAALFGLALAGPAAAQSTAADILSALEGPTAELEQLMGVLEGPNEEKALTAMRLMLASGDPAMERMALRAGLTSTSGVARGVALEAYLAGQPTLTAFAEAEGEPGTYFETWLGQVGAVSSENTGVFAIPVGPMIADKNCFGTPSDPTECGVRQGGAEVSFYIGRSWGTVRLNENGELVGSISNRANSSTFTGPIALTIPLLGQLQ